MLIIIKEEIDFRNIWMSRNKWVFFGFKNILTKFVARGVFFEIIYLSVEIALGTLKRGVIAWEGDTHRCGHQFLERKRFGETFRIEAVFI